MVPPGCRASKGLNTAMAAPNSLRVTPGDNSVESKYVIQNKWHGLIFLRKW